MEFVNLGLDGLIEIRPRKISDERGYFAEIFREAEFVQHAGLVKFVQENQSLSLRPGTIRGIHFQTHPAAQGKLVRCVAGALLDIAVDLRRDSQTFGQWASVELSSENNNQLWVPIGFGHAFCTLEPNSIITYRVTSYYSRDHDKGVCWDDPDIGIDWPAIVDPDTLSLKDRQQSALRHLPDYFSIAD